MSPMSTFHVPSLPNPLLNFCLPYDSVFPRARFGSGQTKIIPELGLEKDKPY